MVKERSWRVMGMVILVLWASYTALGQNSTIPNPEFKEADITCLRTVKGQLQDTQGSLYTWNFTNTTKGATCYFVGVQCWHNDDDKLLSLKLQGMDLGGHFPDGLKYCGSMTTLDLSSNSLSGTIPTDLCKWLPFLVNLDLSNNAFTGNIPANLRNCTYLNQLDLSGNRLTGSVPWELTLLDRLKDFDVSGNQLSGPLSTALTRFNATSFENNPGLCGSPLPDCQSSSKSSTAAVIGGAVGGLVVISVLGFALWWFFIRLTPRQIAELKDDSKWAKRMKHYKSAHVSMFEKPLIKMRLSDLMTATNDFSSENIIGTGRAGTVYKATLQDGSMMAIKRLLNTAQTDKQFKSEMTTLGRFRHRNLVPFLGYCLAGDEKLLVYKHMVNGSLRSHLHDHQHEGVFLDWPKRLRVAIGAARGLAWLHHSCNPRVIHRNISSTSILLDDDFEARITDFGLARLMNPVDTHLSTMINGDFGELGYVAPEYMRTLVATLKGDVYSFGVVLLELVTGKTPINIDNGENGYKGNLVDWIQELSNNGKVEEAIDQSLLGQGYDQEMLQLLRVACSCVLSTPKERPAMFEVYQLLRAIGEKYNFSEENDELVMLYNDSNYHDELIVSRED